MPKSIFDFQEAIVRRALSMGRAGIFADTGLGKTRIELTIAENVKRVKRGRTLILTPLAVAFQFLDEASAIGVDDIEHTRDVKHQKSIVVCNYERMHMLNANDFDCVIADESSILKNFNGKTRDDVIQFMRGVEYRFLCTATPAPNDFIELGNSSEALGHMGYMDMLGRFFRSNQGSVDSNNRNIGEKFYLMPHAERDFFAWVNSWSVMVKKPSDLGFDDDRFVLPSLITNERIVKNDRAWCIDGQASMFAMPAQLMTEVREEQALTVSERCELAAGLAIGKTSVYWCNRNDESDLLATLDKDAHEIRGSMSIDQKEELLVAFARQQIDRLITKPKMTSMGLNWQHCNHTVFFPTWSYEQWYQSIRRFWRFGQTRDVTCEMVISEGQARVVQALKEKTQKAIELYENMVSAANDRFDYSARHFDVEAKLPEFVK